MATGFSAAFLWAPLVELKDATGRVGVLHDALLWRRSGEGLVELPEAGPRKYQRLNGHERRYAMGSDVVGAKLYMTDAGPSARRRFRSVEKIALSSAPQRTRPPARETMGSTRRMPSPPANSAFAAPRRGGRRSPRR